MSWSIGVKGTKAEVESGDVAARFKTQMDASAHQYASTPEGADIEAVRDRALALLGKLDLVSGYDGVEVSAYGSHSTTDNGICAASMHLTITPTTTPKV